MKKYKSFSISGIKFTIQLPKDYNHHVQHRKQEKAVIRSISKLYLLLFDLRIQTSQPPQFKLNNKSCSCSTYCSSVCVYSSWCLTHNWREHKSRYMKYFTSQPKVLKIAQTKFDISDKMLHSLMIPSFYHFIIAVIWCSKYAFLTQQIISTFKFQPSVKSFQGYLNSKFHI